MGPNRLFRLIFYTVIVGVLNYENQWGRTIPRSLSIETELLIRLHSFIEREKENNQYYATEPAQFGSDR